MLRKILATIITLSFPLTGVLSSCSVYNNPLGNNVVSRNINTSVSGIAEFPHSEFKTKATVDDITPDSTVSIIYPPDHPTSPNRTIATGLSENDGSFG